MKIPGGAVTDAIIAQAMAPFIIRTQESAKTSDIPEGRLTTSELAFLHDVALVPDCGVVARYTRLHLSGRQGDKVKRSLLDLGLVEEIEKLTPTGRKKVLRLTEKGVRVLTG